MTGAEQYRGHNATRHAHADCTYHLILFAASAEGGGEGRGGRYIGALVSAGAL